MILPAYATPEEIPGPEDPRTERFPRVEHQLRYVPGTRRAQSAAIALVGWDGERRVIQLEPLLCFRMKGIGYTHPEWGHGMWKGELAIAGESWRTANLDTSALDKQPLHP